VGLFVVEWRVERRRRSPWASKPKNIARRFYDLVWIKRDMAEAAHPSAMPASGSIGYRSSRAGSLRPHSEKIPIGLLRILSGDRHDDGRGLARRGPMDYHGKTYGRFRRCLRDPRKRSPRISCPLQSQQCPPSFSVYPFSADVSLVTPPGIAPPTSRMDA